MPRGLIVVVLLLITIPAYAESSYRLNPGDLLEISIWNEESMLRQVTVLPDGSISYPLVGRLGVSGRTVQEVEDEIERRLKPFFPDPFLTVSVLEARGNRIFVLGEVRAPGAYIMSQPIDVMQALSLAGGLAEFADEGRIRVLRRGAGPEPEAIAVNYRAMRRGEALADNILLVPGDVVVVPPDSLF